MLYLVATPIGNLKDFSHRAIDILSSCDYILCEDTRHSAILLKHYNISAPLRSFHKFNCKKTEGRILEDLAEGKTIALISDAGSPLIADPGEELVAACVEKGLPFTAIPGACAVTTALLLSGMPSAPFQFVGFLPKKAGALKKIISKLLTYPGTTLTYDSPHHIEESLEELDLQAPERALCIARELTKKHEECLRGTASEILAHFKDHPPRGEFVLLISPPSETKALPRPSKTLVSTLESELNLSRKEAIKLAAELTGTPKRDVYNTVAQ